MINILISPEFVHRANTLTPIRIEDTDVNLYDNYKYIIGIAYEQNSTNIIQQNNINGTIYTQLNFGFNVIQTKGETILLKMSTLTQYDGLYTILEKVGNQITIDLPFVLGLPALESFSIFRYINYKFTPDLEQEAKTQLQSVLTNYVTTKIPDLNSLYEKANETEFQYWLTTMREFDYSLLFIDNTSLVGGFLGFITTDLPLYEIGETINIIQDQYEWTFDLTQDDGGNLQLVNNTTITNFQVGQIINVFGNGINGYYEILAIDVTLQQVTINFPFVIGIGPSGTLYGTPAPQYDGVTTITDILIDSPVVGQYTIVTDKPFNQSTQAIGGNILAYPNKKVINELQTFDNKSVYHGTNKTNDYDPIRFVDFYFNIDDDKSPNTIMTPWDYFNDTRIFNIDKSLTYKFLIHTAYSIPNNLQMVLFDNSGAQIYNGIQTINLTDKNFYFEANPNKWVGNGTPVLTQANVDNAVFINYQMFDGDNDTEMTRQFGFNLINKCNKFQYKYILIFEDHLGSYISMPFFMKSKKKIGKKSNSIYKKVGKFDLNNNTFDHNTMDGGNESYSTEYINSFILNTDYIDKNENTIFEDLFTSNNIFMQDISNVNSLPIRVNLNKNELQLIDSRDDLVKYTLEVSESVKQTIK